MQRYALTLLRNSYQWWSPPEYFSDSTTEETMSKNPEANTLLFFISFFNTGASIIDNFQQTYITSSTTVEKYSDLIVLFRIKNLLQYTLVSSYAIQK